MASSASRQYAKVLVRALRVSSVSRQIGRFRGVPEILVQESCRHMSVIGSQVLSDPTAAGTRATFTPLKRRQPRPQRRPLVPASTVETSDHCATIGQQSKVSVLRWAVASIVRRTVWLPGISTATSTGDPSVPMIASVPCAPA